MEFLTKHHEAEHSFRSSSDPRSIGEPENDADVVIFAGDIARPKQALSWASGLGKPVLYVPGNHEFYGNTIAGTLEALEGLCAGTQVRVLVNKEVRIGNVHFLGTTLWTDFMLFDASEKRDAPIQAAIAGMYDFSKIFVEDTERRLFTPEFPTPSTCWTGGAYACGCMATRTTASTICSMALESCVTHAATQMARETRTGSSMRISRS